jgi:ribosomal protein S18 acetylase RimI-like enzyme
MRCVTQNDADVIAELEMQVFPENCFNETTIAKEIELGTGWVIELADEVVAYALVRDDGYLLDLTRLGVREDCRGMGLGAMLLDRLLGIQRDTMLTVRVTNETALHLYRTRGFQIVGRFRDGGSWVMLRAT